MTTDELISLEQAAELVDRAPVTLRQAAEAGRLRAVRIGGRWATTREDAAAYVAAARSGRGWMNAPEYRRSRPPP